VRTGRAFGLRFPNRPVLMEPLHESEGSMICTTDQLANCKPKHLSTREVTIMTGVAARTLRRWIASGLFPKPLTAGPRRGWRFDRTAIELWLAEHGATPPLASASPSNPALALLEKLLAVAVSQTADPDLARWARKLLAGQKASGTLATPDASGAPSNTTSPHALREASPTIRPPGRKDSAESPFSHP
jgi:predicted DNA-binding transcriptional regulator AlpA